MSATSRVLDHDDLAALLERSGVRVQRGGLRPHPKSGRNRLVSVDGPDRTRWIAKQTTADLARRSAEVWFYACAADRFGAAPACLVADLETATVVVEDVHAGRTLLDIARESPRDAIDALARLGAPLARLHAMSADLRDAPSTSAVLPELDPTPLVEWCHLPSAARRMVQVFQQRENLAKAYADVLTPREPLGLIHGDLKLDNVLRAEDRLVLIDWELCGIGPLAWDLGAVLGSALVIWSDELKPGADTESDQWTRGCELPFHEVAASLRRFVASYLDGLPSSVTAPTRDDVAMHAAAWIVARVWADTFLSIQFTGRHHLRLLIAENLARAPHHLFGDMRW